MDRDSKNNFLNPKDSDNRKNRSLSKGSMPKISKQSPYTIRQALHSETAKASKNLSVSGPLEISQITPANIENSKQDFLKLLTKNSIPKALCEVYMSLISSLSLRNALAFMLKESRGIESKNSKLFSSLKAVKAWQESLMTIKEMASYLKENPNWVGMKEVVKECAESLSTHILLTINMVENVKAWKEEVKINCFELNRHITFPVNQEDIFIELKSSCDFLVDSTIKDLFPISKNDPFLMSIAKEASAAKKSKKNGSTQIVTVEKNKVFILISKEVMDKMKKVSFEINKEEPDSSINATISPVYKSLPSITLKVKPGFDIAGVSKLFSERYLKEIIDDYAKSIALEVAYGMFADSFCNKYLGIVNDLVKEIATNAVADAHHEISSKNAKRLQIFTIIEGIIRKLIESEIADLNLEGMCQEILSDCIGAQEKQARNPEAKRRLTRISMNFEWERLSELLYNSIIDDFVSDDWVALLATSSLGVSQMKKTQMAPLIINNRSIAVEEAEDYALEVFTPGAHSPNQVHTEEECLDSPLHKYEELPTTKKVFFPELKSLKNLQIAPIGDADHIISKTLHEYYSMIPSEFSTLLLDLTQVFAEAELLLDTKFFWLTIDGKISGALVYSVNAAASIVHHLSCLNFSLFPDLFSFVLNIGKFETGIIEFHFKKDINECKSVMKMAQKKGFEVVTFENEATAIVCKWPNSGKALFKSQVVACCVIETAENPEVNGKVSADMIEIGNRHCMITALLAAFEANYDINQIGDDNSIRLQQDINELLEIVFSLNYRQYPLISTTVNVNKQKLSTILQENSLKLPSTIDSSTVAIINLPLMIPSCSFVTHKIAAIEYKYLRFKSSQIQQRVGDAGTMMFILPSQNPEIFVFFIKSSAIINELMIGVKRGKTDLYYNIDNLVKALLTPEPFDGELWVPCFVKEFSWRVPWVEGFRLETEKNVGVSKCMESASISINYAGQANKTLHFNCKPKNCIEEAFIFGVYHMDVKEKLDSPLFLSLIKLDHWIKI